MLQPTPDYEERLAASRKLVAALKTSGPWLPDHTLDQVAAAAAEAHHLGHRLAGILQVLEPERRWQSRCVDTNLGTVDEVDARVLAALAGCQPCHHIRRDGPQPAFAVLALRRLECARCRQTVRRPPPGDDDRCDWCGTPGVVLFTPLALQRGPVVLLGGACDQCAAVLREAAA